MLLLGATTAGCGEQDSSAVAVERIDRLNDGKDDDLPAVIASPPGGASPYETPSDAPTYEPPELDRTELDAHLTALSADDRALVDHYLGAGREAGWGEGTWIVAAPMTVAEAQARLLGPTPTPAKRRDFTSATRSAYGFAQVGEAVVAWEQSGFADPPRRLLAELSRDGAVSAVATDNIEAMTRFGYARDGQVVFDDYEYAFVDSLDEIPAEVRDLARLAWSGLEGPMVETADWFAVAMAMSEKVTGVRSPGIDAFDDVDDWYSVPIAWGAMEDG